MSPVKIIKDKVQKYILVELEAETGPHLWGNPEAQWHKDIAAEMESSGLKIKSVLGGGKLLPQTATRQIYVWGESSNYGTADFEKVQRLLQAEFSDYEVLNFDPDIKK